MAVQVKRDGQAKATFDSGNDTADHNAAFGWLLHAQGQSVDWAIKYEGWEITDGVPSTAGPRVSVIYRGREGRQVTYGLILSENPGQQAGPYDFDEAASQVASLARIGHEAARELVFQAGPRSHMATVEIGDRLGPEA